MIKGNVLDVADIAFEILAKKEVKCDAIKQNESEFEKKHNSFSLYASIY